MTVAQFLGLCVSFSLLLAIANFSQLGVVSSVFAEEHSSNMLRTVGTDISISSMTNNTFSDRISSILAISAGELHEQIKDDIRNLIQKTGKNYTEATVLLFDQMQNQNLITDQERQTLSNLFLNLSAAPEISPSLQAEVSSSFQDANRTSSAAGVTLMSIMNQSSDGVRVQMSNADQADVFCAALGFVEGAIVGAIIGAAICSALAE
jgi:glucuronate isomerase